MWESPVFRSKQEAAVFAWMMSAAQWRNTRISTKFGPVELRTGEVLIAERELADDFGLHRNTVRALLQRMVDDGVIELFRDRCPHRAGTIARIRNYETYQGSKDASNISEDRRKTECRTAEGPKKDQTGTKNNEGKEGKEENLESSLRSDLSPCLRPTTLKSGPTSEEISIAVDLYNAAADRAGLPKAQKLSDARRRKLGARLQDCGGLPGWEVALEKVEASPFLTGKVAMRDGGTFRADFDFLCQEKSFTKLLEGSYDNRGAGRSALNRSSDLSDVFRDLRVRVNAHAA
jgi:DNA-binding transcriptional regulator YhcF (GntR family)